MKVTLLQMDLAWADVKNNLATAEQLIMSSERSDLYVLPEMFSTGFITDPTHTELYTDAVVSWMHRMADTTNAAIVGSIPFYNGGKYRNRMYFIKPHEADEQYYDKHHLFSYGNENIYYERGGERVIVEWRGVRFMLLVCYDLRFPIWNRNNGDYDAAIYVASWPVSRQLAWATLLRARAIENQCYVIGVNRIGSDPVCEYVGGTILIDAYGRTTVAATDSCQQTISADLDMEWLHSFWEKFPVLSDRD